MLHYIKELFQKTSWLKTKETGDHKAIIRGRITAVKDKQQPIQQNQHGRSMVEMLGVLAIMGILSIGALAGYRYAMDKYRANATMNDINLRGVDLIIQASRNIPLNLDEWSATSTAGYTFGTPERTTEGTIALDISGLPERVCEMVVDGLSSQFDMDINGAQIDTGATCGDDNIITVYFDGGSGDGTGDACADVTCPECQLCVNGSCTSSPDNMSCDGGYCESGMCIKEEKPKYSDPECKVAEDCASRDSECVVCKGYCDTWTNNGKECHEDNTEEAGTCSNGYCHAGSCTSNSDCASGYFCADTNESCDTAHPKSCQKLNFVRKTITLSSGTSETWYASNYWLSWWDAENACRKLGKRLARADEMVEGFDSTQSWKVYTLTERAEKLEEAFGHNFYYWLSDSYNSCYAFSVPLSNGVVGPNGRNHCCTLALCR